MGDSLTFLKSSGVSIERVEEVPVQRDRADRDPPLHVWSTSHGELKLRCLESSEDVERHVQIRAANRSLPMPDIVLAGSCFLAERWIDGQPLQPTDINGDLMYLLGDVVGTFAKQPCDLQPELERLRSSKGALDKLQTFLLEFQSQGVLAPEICEALHERAAANAPMCSESGFVHLDLKPENIVKTKDGMVVIDNESLSLGALDYELARIWLFWSLTPHERSRFLEGYRNHRCTKSFLLHELFWSIVALVNSLWYRVRNRLPYQDLEQAIAEIARGELLFSWFESKAVKARQLGSAKIRVAFLMDYLAIGGQERVCYEMLRAFDRRVFQPYLYAFRGGALAKAFQSLDVPVMIGSACDPLASKEWTPQDSLEKIDYDRRLVQALREDRIEAAVVFSWKTAPSVLREAGVGVAIDKLDGPSLLGKIQDKSGFHWIVPESETLRAEMKLRQAEYAFSETKLATIYPGIDLDSFDPKAWNKTVERQQLGLREDQLVIGFVGRLIPGKDVEFLVRAFARLLKRVEAIADRCVLLICGPDGGALESILEEVRSLELQSHFRYLPPPANVAQVMSLFDIFAMSSKSEGLPGVILEAMAMGLPIVSTATGSIPEVLCENGYVSELGNWKPFVTHLAWLVRSSEKRQRMGEASRRIAARFSNRHAVGRYEELLIDALLATRATAETA
ncbi:MAG: glycosyltransferase [Pirellula sp.]